MVRIRGTTDRADFQSVHTKTRKNDCTEIPSCLAMTWAML